MNFPIYLDNQSTTPVDPRVFEAMKPYFLEKYGNASSKNHSFGWEANSAVENSRNKIAEYIGADSNEIIFTAGATESINLVHFGIAEAYYSRGNHIITTAIEHSAVLDSLKLLEKKGFNISILNVNSDGFIDIDELKDLINEKTILVSIQAANNEIGTVNNLNEIGKICNEKNVLFHTDSAQALGKIKFNVDDFHIDMASFSAHKLYGPKGVGALYIRKKNPKINLIPQLYGGGQENNLRSGTLNVPGIVGFGKAVEVISGEFENEYVRIKVLRDKLWDGIKGKLNEVKLNGSMNNRLPNNLNICIENVNAESLILELRDIAVSTGAACSSESVKPSHVLTAIGLDVKSARSSIRFGIGRFNTEEEINYTIDKVVKSVNKIRKLSPEYKLKNENLLNQE